MARRDELTDEQWAIIKPLLPPPVIREDGRGRPRVHDDRAVLNGVLWVLRTGSCWMDLPDRFPSGSTCYRRFSHWVKTDTLRKVLEVLAQHLEESKDIDLSECFIDGTFVVAKKGGQVWERPSGAKVQSSWWLRTLQVFHSQCTRLLLHLMKSPLSKLPSMKPSRWDDPEELSGIVPMTVIRLMKSSRKWVLN
jgi:transposase